MLYRVPLFLLPLLLFLACNRSNVTPDFVANQFLSAYHSQNFDTASQFIHNETLAEWTSFVKYQQKFPDTIPREFFIDTVLMAEDNALAVVQYYTGRDSQLRQMNLKKKAGTWKVLFGTRDPQSVAQNFLSAFNSGDYKTARTFLTHNAQRDFDMLIRKGHVPEQKTVRVKDVVMSKSLDKAVVYFTEGDEDAVKKINLRKESGDWKVTFTKMDNFEPAEPVSTINPTL